MNKRTIFILIGLLTLINFELYSQSQDHVYGSYEFDTGFYYMLDYPVNIRSQPNLQGGVIGKLGLNDKIEILENAGNEQKIDNVWAYWYKIRFNNITGYIWGGYIAVKTLVFDIDGNGIDDYFYYRISDVKNVFYGFDTVRDIFIYINNERKLISIKNSEGKTFRWNFYCVFEKGRNKVIMKLINPGPPGDDDYIEIYEIDKNGTLKFIEKN
jgi:hypothetical protein